MITSNLGLKLDNVKEQQKRMEEEKVELEEEQKLVEEQEVQSNLDEMMSDNTQFDSIMKKQQAIQDGDQGKQEQASVAASSQVEQVNQMKTLNNLVKNKTTPYLIRILYVIEFMKLIVYLLFNIILIVVIQSNLTELKNMQPNCLS